MPEANVLPESAGDSHVDHRLFVSRGHDPTPSGLLVLRVDRRHHRTPMGFGHSLFRFEGVADDAGLGRRRTRSRPAHRSSSHGVGRYGHEAAPSAALVP